MSRKLDASRSDRPAGTRGLLLREAADLFMEEGFVQAPLSELAARLNFTKAALYYHFKSKDLILVAIVGPMLDEIDELLDQAVHRCSTPRGLVELLDAYAGTLTEHRSALALINHDLNVQNHPAIAPRIASHESRLLELLAGPRPSHDKIVRAFAAMTLITRGMAGSTSDNKMLSRVSVQTYRRTLLSLATELCQLDTTT